MSRRGPSLKTLARRAAALTARHPVGTPCRYWPGPVGRGEPRDTRTRSEFSVLGGHTVVVWVESEGGCVSADHLEYPVVSEFAQGGS